MRINHVARCAAMTIACVSMIGAARGGQLPQEIVNQYRPAVEKLRQAYTHGSFEGTSSLAFPGRDKSRTQEFVMRASGQKRRLDVKTTRQTGMRLTVGATQLRMATPYGSLSTTTAPGSKYFDDAQQIPYAEIVSQIDNGCLLNYPYSLDSSGTILDMLLRPSVKVTSVKKIESFGEPLVEIYYEETARHAGQTGLWKSSLVLSPADGWALRGFSRSMGQGSDAITERARLTYSGEQDGIPLVQSIESETLKGTKPTRQESIEISSAKLGDPDDYYFTSFAF